MNNRNSTRRTRLVLYLSLGPLLVLLIAGCQHNATHNQMMSDHTPQMMNQTEASPALTNEQPDVIFTLQTELRVGGFVFAGVGGEIDGQLNPVLEASVGEVVEIILINGDGVLHDLVLPEINASTSRISQLDSQASLRFRAEAIGDYAYYCSVSGHRALGMEGVIRVLE